MKLAAIQYRPPKGKPEQARKELLRLIEAAGREGADLVVCPELATTGYMWDSPQELVPHSESPRGPHFKCSLPLPKSIIPGLFVGLRSDSSIIQTRTQEVRVVVWPTYSTPLWW